MESCSRKARSSCSANKGGKGVIEKLNVKVPTEREAGDNRVKNPDANSTADAKYDLTVQEATTGDNVP